MTNEYHEKMEKYKSELTIESAQQANRLGVTGTGHNDALDAFRHAYSSAIITYDYNRGIAYAAGVYNEWKDNNPVGEDRMDTHNNEIGRAIGSEATSREDIAKKVYEALTQGQLILSPDEDLTTSPVNLLPGDGVMNGGAQSFGRFDPTALISLLGGRKARHQGASQIALTSAAALARELTKSRRRALETDIIDLFGGGRKGQDDIFTTVPTGNRSSGGITNLLFDTVERLVGGALSRTRTRTSTQESQRSQEAGRNWNLSAGQQQAMLAQWAQRGTRNL